ncbi:MAG: hypothetical protein HOV68_21745 [Streptomycetaceae bacterium]|nr:hypothetical protein [Streptomycetaceae bacterium]
MALSEVPEGVRDVLRRRLGRLPEASVTVLRLAAVAGREADAEVLVGASDTDEDGVFAALEAGLIAGLLVEPEPGRVRFVHALVRETLLADLSLLRSTRMHGRIAASLERLGSHDVSALAHHYARTASSATAAKAVDYCVRAAALAEGRFAHAAAVDLLGDALTSFARIPADASSDRDAELLDLLGRLLRAQVRTGAVIAARETRQRAIDRAVAADREDLLIRAFTAWTETTPWQSRTYGTVDEPVVAHLERLLRGDDLEPAVRCRLLDAFCAELSDTGDPRVRAAAEEAVALSEGLDDPPLRAQALARLASELDAALEVRRYAELGREIDRMGTAHGLPVYRWFGVFTQACAAAVEGEVAAARRHIDACMELARAYRMPEPLTVGETALATLAHIDGRFADAERLYAQATAGMARHGSPHAEGFMVVATATIRATQGRLGECVPEVRRMVEEFGPVLDDLLAVVLVADGQLDEARRVLARLGPVPRDFFFAVFATFRTMAMSALGETKGAQELYDMLLPYRDAPPSVAGFSVAIRPMAATLAELATLLGRDDEAAEHAAHAAAIAARWESA